MTDETISTPAFGPASAGAEEPGALEPGEVPAGYSDRGGTDRCDTCTFFSLKVAGPDGAAPGECLVHGAPPYIVDAGGWCPAWEAEEDGVPPFPSFGALGDKTC